MSYTYVYYLKDPLWPDGQIQLKSNNLEEAKEEVQWDYANSGERAIIEEKYQLIKIESYSVDTDY